MSLYDAGNSIRKNERHYGSSISITTRIVPSRFRSDDDVHLDQVLPNISFTEHMQRYWM
jgi:hypothetical protein